MMGHICLPTHPPTYVQQVERDVDVVVAHREHQRREPVHAADRHADMCMGVCVGGEGGKGSIVCYT